MSDTIAALSTPSGESAVALVRLSGGDCRRIAREIFGKQTIAPRNANFGIYRDLCGNFLDETIYAFFAAPSSYTGEDMLEISCHGNPFIVRKMLDDLIARGARAAQPGEFTRRAFMNDKLDLSQAEAVALVIGARSARALEAAQKQLSGELGRRITKLSDSLMDMLAMAEAYIDFPEDDLPPEDERSLTESADSLSKQIESLLETAKYSHLVHRGINAVITGSPNAGKSSLLNSLVGDERAIVSETAGTTRDFITETVLIGKYSLNLTDTAGLREPRSEIEAKGIKLAVEKLKLCDIRLLVLDAASPMPDLPAEAAGTFSPQNTIIALNKCDLKDAKPSEFQNLSSRFETVEVSCRKGFGIDALRESIIKLIEKFHIRASADDVLVGARHAAALERALVSVREARKKIASGAAGELVASDLREALNSLGEILGKTDNEDVLDRIFSKFCIGK